jgi:hypothetical protein
VEAGDSARLRYRGRARQAFLDEQEAMPSSAIARLTVTELVIRYLDDCEATERLGWGTSRRSQCPCDRVA